MSWKAASRLTLWVALSATLTCPSPARAADSMAAGKLPPAAKLLPAGFTVTTDRDLGGSYIIEGTKPNASVPKPHADLGITLGCAWLASATPEQIVEMVAQQPEEPAAQVPGSATREEPAGKEKHKGGILIWRKVITPWIGQGTGPDLVAYRGGWMYAVSGGYVTVGVNNFVGSKEGALALIDEVIANLVGADSGSAAADSAKPAEATQTTKAKPAEAAKTTTAKPKPGR